MNTTANVLIVDDDPDYRKLLVRMVAFEGYSVADARNVAEAMQQLEKYETDVVLTDVHMPDGNGVELTRMVKAAYPHIEIIAVTSEGSIEDGVKAIKNGAFNYLEKGKDDTRMMLLLGEAAEKALLQKRVSQLEQQVNNLEPKNDIIGSNQAQLNRATEIINALHSPVGQQIIQLIFKQGRISGKEISDRLDLPEDITLQHLTILKNAKLVSDQHDGQHVFYSANYIGIEKVIAFVQQLIGSN